MIIDGIQQQTIDCPWDVPKLFRRVFDGLWDVSMPRQWTYSQFDYEERGIMVTGDVDLDNQSMRSWTNTQRTIAQLAEMYDEGKEFIIRDLQQVKMIFDIILDYTNFVAWRFNNSINLTSQVVAQNQHVADVLNDVVKLQNLGNKIFPIVMDHVKLKPETEGLMGLLNQLDGGCGYMTRSLEFNPFERYGITADKYLQRYDAKTEVAQVLDLREALNIQALDRVGNHL